MIKKTKMGRPVFMAWLDRERTPAPRVALVRLKAEAQLVPEDSQDLFVCFSIVSCIFSS